MTHQIVQIEVGHVADTHTHTHTHTNTHTHTHAEAGPAGPAGWDMCWYDISTGVPTSQLSLLYGGEMSMWTDTYCYVDQVCVCVCECV
jgi:hypothetical protein